MPFPMLPAEPVLSTEGRFFLPADTEDAFGLCAKIMTHHKSNEGCAWGNPVTRTTSHLKARGAAQTALAIESHSKDLGHV